MTMTRLAGRAGGAVLLGLALGCREEPAAPRPSDAPRQALAATGPTGAVPIACDRNWAAPVDGDWNDRYAWVPNAIPTAGTTVCFVDPGGYTITLPDSVTVRSMLLTSGVNVAFTSQAADLVVNESVDVRAGAGLVLRDRVHLFADSVGVVGEFRLKGWSDLEEVRVLHNRGVLEFDTWGHGNATRMVNEGEISLLDRTVIWVDSLFEHRSGAIRGDRLVLVEGSQEHLRVVWTGGTIEGRQGDPVGLETDRATMVLGSSQLTGSIHMNTLSDSLIGHIGRGVHVTVRRESALASLKHEPPEGAPAGSPVVIDGTLRLILESPLVYPYVIAPFLYYVPSSLVNRGRVEVVGRTLWNHLFPKVPTLDNHGVITGTGGTRVTMVLPSLQGQTFRNFGTVDSLYTVLLSGEYVAMAGSRHQDYLNVSGATLRGAGYVRSVWGGDGTISPGTALGEQLPVPLVAALQIDSLWLQPSTTVVADVVSPKATDQVVVGRHVEYGGNLVIRAAASYVPSAGSCGQLVPLFVTSGVPSPGVTYPPVTSVPAGPGRAWRIHHGTDTTWLAGYNPDVPLDMAPSVAVTEGGPAKVVDACLGLPVSTRDVVATLGSVGGDVSVTPSSLTFTASDFALPRRVQLAAVDDAISEGPHIDSIVPLVTAGSGPVGPPARATVVSVTDNDPGVDLTVAMVSTNNPVIGGTQFERRFRVTNVGPGASTGSVVSFPGLAGATFAANRTGANCVVVGVELQCSVGAIAPGGFYEFQVLFNATTVGVYQNTMWVRGLDWDPVPGNDQVVWVLTVQ